MAASNFEACDRKRIKYEGGFSRDQHDPGNWTGGKVGVGRLLGTKYGIAANTYPNVDIPNLTQAEAAKIFRRDYWDKVAGDLQPVGVDLCVYDTAVNSGVGRAIQFQRAILGGSGGYPSLARAAAIEGSYRDQVRKLCAARMAFLRRLSTFGRYGKGWTSRVADVEATATKMVLQAANMPAEAVQKELRKDADKAAGKASNSAKGAGGAGAATGAGGTAATQGGLDWWQWVGIGVVSIALIALAVFLFLKWREHKERAAAFEAAAVEV